MKRFLLILALLLGAVSSWAVNVTTSFSTTLDAKTWKRPEEGTPLCGGKAAGYYAGTFTAISAGTRTFYYGSVTFTPGATGAYTLGMTSATFSDPMIYVYTSFNPASPLTGFVVGDDDTDPSGTHQTPLINCYNTFTAGTTYTLVITSWSTGATGTANFYATGPGAVAVAAAVPSTPGSATGTATGMTTANLSWGASATGSPTGYNWSVVLNGTSTVAASGSTTTATTASATGLSANTSYQLKVYAKNAGGNSATTTSSAFKTYPADPTSITVGTNPICTGNSTTLTANGNQGTVYWYTGSCGGTYVGTGNSIILYPTTSTTYYARNNNGNWSAGCATSAQIVVNPPPTVPASASVSVPAGADGQTKANLSWATSTSGLSPITYYWAVGPGSGVTYESGYTSRGITTHPTVTAQATGLSTSTSYYLAVKSYNSCGASAYRTSSVFRTNHVLTYTANSNGSISGTTPQIVANSGNGSAVTAVPNTEYNFVSWSDGSLARVRTDNTVTSSITVSATFAPNRLAFVTQPVTKVAGVVIPVSVRVTDTYGNTMTNSTAAVTIAIQTNPSIGSAGVLSGTKTVNAVAGVATFTDLWINKTGTGYTLKASSVSPIVTAPISSSFTINPAAIDHFTLAGITDPVIAGTTTTPVVTAYDVYNNIKTDYTGTIQFSANTPHHAEEVLPSYTFLTANNGVKSLTNGVTLKTTGERTVTVTGDTKTGSQTAITVLPAALDHFTLAVNGTITAGTAFTVTATAYDAYSNIKTNYGGASTDQYVSLASSVNWTTTAISAPKGTARIIPANGNKSFINGVSEVSGFTFYSSDQTQLTPFTSPTITITDAATSKLGTTTGITVLNAPLDNFKVVAGITQNAGVAFSTTVTARDIYLNTCVDYAGSIRFKSSDDNVSPSTTGVIFPAGLQAFDPAHRGVEVYAGGVRINRIGAYWLRAADSQFAFKSGEQQNIVVSPGAFLRTASISTLDVDHLDKIAGEEVVVTLIPHDSQGNLLYACQTISVLLDGVVKSGTHQVAHGTDIGSDGVYVFHVPVTSTTADNIISATFQDPVNSAITTFAQTRDITVTPAPPSLAHTIITPDAGSMTTNGTQTVTVQLKDIYNNLRTTDDGVVSLTTTLGGFAGTNGDATEYLATYNTGTTGSYSATLYASYGVSDHGVGTAAITGSIAFNASPGGPGVWDGPGTEGNWPANGSITDAASVAISEGLPDLVTSTLVTDKSTMTTDETATLTLQLKDFLGNLIVNNRGAVTMASDRGVMVNHGYLSAGKYTYTLTAGTTEVNGVGLATISGSFDGNGSPSDVNGNFNDGASTPENTITTVNITEGLPAVSTIVITTAAAQITADDLTAGGQTVVTVQLKDALGNLIVNDRGTVTLSTNLGVIYNGTDIGATNITATYLSPGKYTATFKMNAIGVGTATITGKYNDVAITDNAQVTVINGLATQLATSTAPALLYQPIAGVVFNAQPVIRILDHYGNLVVTGTGSTDVVTATRITNGTAALQGTLTKTAVAGIATFTDLHYDVAESINIQFTSGTLTDQTSAAINVVHNVPNYMVITGSGTQTAGQAQTITIRAYDVYNNLANRFAGTKAMTFTGALQSPVTSSYPTVNATTFTNSTNVVFASGEATASMILYKEETVDIAANFTINPYVDPAAYTSNTAVNINADNSNRLHVVVAQAVPAYLTITGSATQVAGEAQTITITAYDNFNNPATGYTGDKTLRFAGANVSLPPSTSPTVGGVAMGSDKVLTFTNGVATASMNLYKVENAVITATDQVIGTRTSGPDSRLAVSVSHATANYYAVTGTGTQTAGAAQNITVTAYDAWNNQATTYTGDVAVTFSGANPSPNTPGTAVNPTVTNTSDAAIAFGTSTTIHFSGGIATRSMKLYLVETAHIVATAGSITTPVITDYDYRLAVLVNHAANSFFAITGNSTQTAGVSQNITVTMYDVYNNVATGYTGAKSLTFSGANPSPNTPNAAYSPTVNGIAFGTSTSLTFASGAVTTAMNLYKVETALVNVTNTLQTAVNHRLSVAVSHADQNFMAITGTGTQTAGVSQDITIKAYDAFNNIATRFDGAKSLTFSGANVAEAYLPTPATSPVVSATAFGTSTSLTFVSGVVTTAMNLYKVETALVTATNTDNGITIVADTHKLSVVVGQSAPAYLAVTGTGTQSAGANQTITIKAYDAYNNLATAYTGSKNLTFSGAHASAAAVSSNNMPTPTTPATNPTVASTAFGTGTAFTFASGVTTGTMTLYKTETALVSASDATISSNAAPATDHRLSVLINPALLYGFLVYDVPDPHDLGTWQSVTVQAIDTYNNTKTNYVGTITFSNTDIAATNPADYHFVVGDAGIHTFTDGVKFSQVGLDWWLTALDLAEPVKYGAQSGITVQRAVRITANSRTKTYGDVLTMGTTEFTIAGIVPGVGLVTGDFTGATLTCSGADATAHVSGSPYTITPSAATGPYTAVAGGQGAGLYRIVYATSNLTVSKRDLTLSTFLADNKTYDGTTDVTGPSGSRFSDNRVNSDELTFGYTAAFVNKNAGTGKTVNYTGITISGGADAGNYTLVTTSSSTAANVAVRPINVTAQTDTKTYDGSTSSAVAPVVGALQTGDAVTTVGIQTFDSENFGTSKVLTPGGTVINDGNSGANYAITNVTNATGVINRLPITITVTAGQTKVYGESDPGSFAYTVTTGGLASGDAFSGSLSRAAGDNVNTYAIGKNTLTIVESATNKEANYVVTFVGANFSITQRPITLTATDRSKTYGTTLDLGTTAFTKTAGTYATGETATAVVLASDGAINTADVTTYPITIGTATGTGGFTASNYAITYTSGTLTVNKKDLVVTVTAAQTKVYGASDPTFAYTASGFVNSQDYTVFTGSLTRDVGIHVGTYAINQATLSAGGNYNILTFNAANFSITAKPVTITATTDLHKTYGDLDPAVYTYSANVDLAYRDVFSGILSRATGEDVASYAIGRNTLTIVDDAAVNVASDYNITYTGTTFAITQLAVAVTANSGQHKTYGDSDPTLTYTSVPAVGSALANGHTIAFTGNVTRAAGSIVIASPYYAIGIGSLANSNYAITYTGDHFVINQKPITGNFTVVATKTYDGGTSASVLTRTLNGRVGSDAVVLDFGSATYNDKFVGIAKTVTLSGSGLTGVDAFNYSLTSVATTTADITRRDLHLFTFAANSKTYDGNTMASGMGWQDDRLGSDLLSFQWTAEFDSKDVGARHVNYTNIVIFEGTDKPNYNLITPSAEVAVASANITARSLTLNVSGVNREYNNTNVATINYTDNKVTGDVFGINYNATFNDKNVGTGKAVSVTGISLSGTDALNYSLAATASTSANITAKTITISPDAGQSKLVGASDPTFTYTWSPALYSGESFTGALGRNGGTDLINPNVGNYSYTMGSLSAGTNYTLVMTASPATFAIMRNAQDIALITGWNIISSGITPANPDMLNVFNTLIGGSKLTKIMKEDGVSTVYLGNGNWFNDIGNIQSTDGYKVKVNAPCTLTVTGNSVSLPLAIPLGLGWNIISYPASGDQNALAAVQALITAGKLEKVMDERGASIEDWTAYGFGWQNNIGNFTPGKGYLVKVKAACPDLSINEVLDKAATITPEVIASSYFKTAFTGNGFDHMSINLMDLQKSGLRQGDEIGIFDGMVCVGAAMIGADQMISGNMSIPVSANDGLSETINGYIAGNPVRLKLYSNGVESSLKTEIQNNVAAVFKKGESLFLKVSTDAATGINSLSQKLDVKFYPNPFTDVLSVEISSSGEKPIDIMIYDVLGRKIRSLFTGSVNGSQIIEWDGTSDGGSVVRPGIYYMRCNGLMFNGIIKR